MREGHRGARPCGRHGFTILGRAAYFAGVCLLGIDSVMCPIGQRKLAWNRLAIDLDKGKLAEITREINLDQVIGGRRRDPGRPGPRSNRGKNSLTAFRLYQPTCSNVATVGMVSTG